MHNLDVTVQGLQDTSMSIKHLAGRCVQVLGGCAACAPLVLAGTPLRPVYTSLRGSRTCTCRYRYVRQYATIEATVAALAEVAKPQLPSCHLNPPYNLMEDNMSLLKRWLLEHFGRTAFAVDRTPWSLTCSS